MVREWNEDVGRYTPTGRHFVTLISGPHDIHFFAAELPSSALAALDGRENDVGEMLEMWFASAVDGGNALPNLSWLLPLAAYQHDVYGPFTVTEVERGPNAVRTR